MPYKVGYILAGTLFVIVVGLLAFPYLQARLKPIEPIPVTAESPAEVETSESNQLSISELGIEAPIIYIEEKSEPVYQEALRNGVVHFPGTPEPGEFGNVYIFGHSSDYVWAQGDYKTVFAKLPQIELGTDIEVTNAEGELFVYEVIETKVVWPRDLSVLDQFNYEKKILTLQTSYPLGTALQRYIVVAELKAD